MGKFQNDDVVNLFWSGGWDSTFRLLQLLLIEKKSVQTYYIIDLKRESVHSELRAMADIRSTILSEYPFTEKLLFPTICTRTADIKKDRVITSALDMANEKTHFGSQYDWLARFCQQYDIDDMELCIQKDANPETPPRFSPLLQKVGDAKMWIISQELAGTAEYTLFEHFRFPIMDYSKMAIKEIAEKNDWAHIMNKTWFCHHPEPDNTPCGRCIPCQEVKSEYLGYRIPLSSEQRSKLKETKQYQYYRSANNFWKNLMSLAKCTNRCLSKPAFVRNTSKKVL